jgi:hypothetical protein
MQMILTKGLRHEPEGLKLQFSRNNIFIYGDKDVRNIALNSGSELFMIGNVLGIRSTGDSMGKGNDQDIANLFQTKFENNIIYKLEGRFLMMLCNTADGSVQVFSDRYGQFDCYYTINGNKSVFASDLSLFPESPSGNGYDQVGLAHAMTVYGYRPAKKDTIYKNYHRLGVGEVVKVEPEKLEFKQTEFKPLATRDYGESDHERYADLFLEALRIRGSENLNVVYLSSGWDSTSILGGLVHIFGADKVKAVIGRMRYSKRAGIINPYEIERAKKVADYYGVNMDVVEFDYSEVIQHHILEKVKDTMKNNFAYSATLFNHGILADYISRNFSNDISVFSGEISDGVHNFGFSQFATIFHPVQEFREYSDKMASYLYGPTFFDSFINGSFEDDVIFKFLRDQTGDAVFDKLLTEEDTERKKILLASFFLRSNRLPLFSLDNVKQLTENGRRNYTERMESVYLQNASETITSETLYSWVLNLYSSFHWQSSTVVTLPLTAQAYGFDIQLPFYDSRLQEFLASMPENWGRGLDLNPTKFPLKRMLKKRIDYPNHLQVGPHSYLYDVDHSFNHSVELANYSAFKPIFSKLMESHPYIEFLSPEIFDLNYINSLVDRYVDGEEIIGNDLNTIFPLFYTSIIGWY